MPCCRVPAAVCHVHPCREQSSFFEDKGIEPRFRSKLDDFRDSGYDRGHMVGGWVCVCVRRGESVWVRSVGGWHCSKCGNRVLLGIRHQHSTAVPRVPQAAVDVAAVCCCRLLP